MMDFIDIYCERTAPGLWAEPLNALTNISFFIAAFFAFRLAKKQGRLGPETGLLILLLLAIGTGSALFHTFATGWASLADTLPILLFQIAWLMAYAVRVMGMGTRGCAALLAAYLLAVAGFGSLPPHWLNGSLSYFPALLFLLGLGVWHYAAKRQGRVVLLAAAGLFVLSLTFRSVDMALCPAFPAGVHFLWHLFNGAVLYLSLKALILNAGAGRRGAAA